MPKNVNSVRISSGLYKNRAISTPGGATHPMGSRERIALLNTLQPYLEGATVLDMFAGSGALGLEAASRGAKEIVFIDNNREAIRCIKENAKAIFESENSPNQVTWHLKTDLVSEKPATFDVIIADPPYDALNGQENNSINDLLNQLPPLLKEDGILVLSHPGSFDQETLKGLNLQKTKSYAACNLSFYEKA